ncbi:ester cyclase [Pseudonocardia sp. NPDC049154]|uniref:ester cyclase n=1 Tax=Pseudonocardia sp. NPDC049154 TaxID=3155501 RepID=UPI0033CA7311
MNKEWASEYIESFAKGPEYVLAHWAPEGPVVHEDPVLGQRSTRREDIAATFATYANTDPDNGIGIHVFVADEYIGDERSGVTHWTWTAEHCASFLGVPTNGKRIQTRGVSVNVFDEQGRIVRELAYWDAVGIAEQLGVGLSKAH